MNAVLVGSDLHAPPLGIESCSLTPGFALTGMTRRFVNTSGPWRRRLMGHVEAHTLYILLYTHYMYIYHVYIYIHIITCIYIWYLYIYIYIYGIIPIYLIYIYTFIKSN